VELRVGDERRQPAPDLRGHGRVLARVDEHERYREALAALAAAAQLALEGAQLARIEGVGEVPDERASAGGARERIAVLVRLLERLQRLVVVVDVLVRPAPRGAADDVLERRRGAGHLERSVQRHEPRLGDRRRMDHGQAREARGVVERGPHAEIATERVSGGLTAGDAQRVLQLADEGRQRGGRIPAPCDRNGAAARAGQVGHDEAKAVAEALELIAPRVTVVIRPWIRSSGGASRGP